MRCGLGIAVAIAGVFPASAPAPDHRESVVRFATFNIQELRSGKLTAVDPAGHGTNPQLVKAAAVIQRIRPDILLINEIDFDPAARNATLFRDRYLRVSQSGGEPIDFPHLFVAPVNTGVPTGRDLDQDGRADGPGDAFGFGHYPGEYGMALLSRHPIEESRVRTFQRFAWREMPGNLIPDGASGKPPYYTPEQAAVLRLSSKSHWDVPVRTGGATVHVLASHPTPPIFDGPEDRNGRRNFDENRLWADYITGGAAAAYIVDDRGRRGGLPTGELFVIMGDLNSDPVKMEPHAAYSRPTIQQILQHPRVMDPKPRSLGSAVDAADYPGDRTVRTNAFGRIDYVLPCRELPVRDAGVFWPPPGDPLHELVSPPEPSSDHRLVWTDVLVPG
jgi:endonuclease/exonuclease/phosphatase family metal-dependent hydrolase